MNAQRLRLDRARNEPRSEPVVGQARWLRKEVEWVNALENIFFAASGLEVHRDRWTSKPSTYCRHCGNASRKPAIMGVLCRFPGQTQLSAYGGCCPYPKRIEATLTSSMYLLHYQARTGNTGGIRVCTMFITAPQQRHLNCGRFLTQANARLGSKLRRY